MRTSLPPARSALRGPAGALPWLGLFVPPSSTPTAAAKARSPLAPLKAWALVTPAGLYVLASIGPTTGAVMGFLSRAYKRGLAALDEGFRIAPVTIQPDPTRDEDAAAGQARTLRRGLR